MNVLTIGYITEGNTDKRFLGNIIRRTFEDALFEADGQVEVFDPQHILIQSDSFVEEVIKSAKEAKWAHVLCIHTDADDSSEDSALNHKITPAFKAVNEELGAICKNLVPIVPVQMTEAWMLADKNILKEEIGTTRSDGDLQLPRLKSIEGISDPKGTIINAIRLAFENAPRKRRQPTISELYTPLSQKIDLHKLSDLPSYAKFKASAKAALVKLNYIH